MSSFIHEHKDIIIQVMPYKQGYISLDGHTRLYYAVMKGWSSVYAVKELSEKWNGFCSRLFSESEIFSDRD